MKAIRVVAQAFPLIVALVPLIASAASLSGSIVPDCDGPHCTCENLIELANNLLNAGIYLAVFLSAILFAWAGWKMMTGHSMGNSEQINEAKGVIWNVIIGLVIILSSWLLVSTIMGTLTDNKGLGTICK